MDDKEFKKHLQDLVHGHHHPEEHDWSPGSDEPAVTKQRKPAKSAVRKPKRRAK
jgi:hypothetical protein